MAACNACGADNAGTAKFCSECGAALRRTCPSCGADASGRFCSECGAPLSDIAATAARPTIPTQAVERVAERRVVSVLFADIVGFTPLSETRDPEDVRELLSRYFETARTVIERYGGTVEKFIGDAVMAVWGVPTAHEDDAERAVRAALDLVAEVHALADEVAAPGLTMRVGVMTGEVAVTLGATGEGMVAGDAVNTASRIQSVAAPGHVWVDERTRGLAAAVVAFDDAGRHELKGKSEPVQLFVARDVVAARGGAQRVDGLEAPFIGRERELRLVKEMFHATVEERRARCVTVIGAPGIGKSRLSWEFEKYVDGIEHVTAWHRGRCLSYGEGVAFYAFAEMIRGRLKVVEGDAPDVVAQKLDENLVEVVRDPTEREWLRPRLAALIGLSDGAEVRSRRELFPAWRVYLERLSEPDSSVLLVVEDVQWADEGLVAFIEHLLEAANFPIFILALTRPEFLDANPTWSGHRRVTTVYLEPLGYEQLSTLVDGLVEGLPGDVRASLVERAEGIPLYAVETVRALIDRDAVIPRDGRYVLADDASERVDLSTLAAPASLHALIAARLDALPADEKRIIQDASVLGHSFTPDGLRALITATSGDASDLEQALAALTRKEFFRIEADPFSPERGLYRFVQGLVRTVAYDSLTKRDRKSRHLVAAGFYDTAPEADELPAVTASHYVAAYEAAPQDPDAPELAAKARVLLDRAGQRAETVGSMGEAERHYLAALALAHEASEIAELAEASARAANGAGRYFEAVAHADRSEAAYRDLGRDIDAARAVAIAGEALMSHGDLAAASTRMRVALDAVSGSTGSEDVQLMLTHMLAAAERSAGRLPAAAEYYERAISLAEATSNWPRLVRLLTAYGGQMMVTGRPAMGIAVIRGSLDLARREAPGWVVGPLATLAALQMYRELDEARAVAREGMAAARHLGDRFTEALLVANLSVVLWLDGEWDELLSLNAELSAAGASTGTIEWGRSLMVALALEARDRLGELDLSGLVQSSGEDIAMQAFNGLVEALRANAAGKVDEAAQHAIAGIDFIHQAVRIDDDFPTFWPIAIEYALRAGRLGDADRLFNLVADSPPGLVVAFLRAQLPRMRALINIARGRPDGVDDDLSVAIDALRSFGAVYWTARAQLDRADWLQSQHRDVEAEPLLKEAAETFERLGASPWVERVRLLTQARV